MRVWKITEVNALKEMWGTHTTLEIAESLGRSYYSISSQAERLGLGPPFRGRRRVRQPPASEWTRIAGECAKEAGINVVPLLAGNSARKFAHVRWRAWQRLLDSNPKWSMAGVARVSGHDHTAVRHGLQRLQEMGAA